MCRALQDCDPSRRFLGQLVISAETVRTHVRNAMARLGAHTRAQLVAKVLCAEHAIHPSRLGG
jgi:DNA-binding CsgD family transcriptional regulator